MANDLLDGADDRKAVSNFWTPTVEGEAILGKLDRIDTNKFGDVAHFDGAAKLPPGSMEGNGYAKTLNLGISANLDGRITTADAGKLIYVRFDKYVPTPNGQARNFTVKVPDPLRAAKVISDAKAARGDDDLPF